MVIKQKAKKKNGYVNIIPTESSFNSVVKNIFNSKLCSDFAFIEPLLEVIPKKLANNKIHNCHGVSPMGSPARR